MVDISRRMDRLEQNHEALAKDVAALTGTISRVEQNQQHLEELNRLRFGSLDNSIAGVTNKLDAFIARIEALLTGEVQTPQMRSGNELVADYKAWRASVDKEIEDLQESRQTAEILAKERERIASEGRVRFQWRVGLVAALTASVTSALIATVIRVLIPTH